jgi:2-polyprenyl-3-methyl-5-hydroxy-6-metoxy-1,4-benzoquinol methylase
VFEQDSVDRDSGSSHAFDPDIAAHYELDQEHGRLFADGRPRLEYLRTIELLQRVLPAPPAKVLDVGGGTGVYGVPLAELGFTVHVVDPVDLHVERATQLAFEHNLGNMTAAVGDARDLTLYTAEYDAVLLLGPLYHLTEVADRIRAFQQAIEAARPGGVVVGVGISRYASLLDGMKSGILGDPEFRPIVERDLIDGQHRNPDPRSRPQFFTTAYFHHPDELRAEATAAGLTEVELFAIEGPAWILENADDIDNQVFVARMTESEPAMIAVSAHMMVVGRVQDPALFYTGLVAEAYAPLRGAVARVDVYEKFVRRHGEPALEIGCGHGEPLLDLCAAGLDVTGLDASSDMLELCANEAARRGLQVRLVCQRMEELDLATRFRSIYFAGPTFQLVVDPERARTTLERIRDHLAADGRCLIPLFVPTPFAPDEFGIWREDHTGSNNVLAFQTLRQSYRADQRRVDTTLQYRRGPAGNPVELTERVWSLRWYEPGEFEALVAAAGMEVERRWDTGGSTYLLRRAAMLDSSV